MSETVVYQINDLVWAKMKGFSPWPGRIAEPPNELKRTTTKKNLAQQCIFFFGSNNYAWIEESNIKPYVEFKERLTKSCKTAAFKEAVEQIESFIKDPVKYSIEFEATRDTDADFNKLRETESESVTPTSPTTVVMPPKKSSPKKKARNVKSLENRSMQKNNDDGVSPPPSKRKRLSSDKNEDSIGELDNFSPGRRNFSASLLNRPSTVQRPEIAEIDMSLISQTLKSKNIHPSPLKFGFLGLGIMGSGIVKNLINSGHKVVVWNRTITKCRKFEDAGAEVLHTPSDVVDATDITFSCVADPQAAKDMVFGNCGVLQASSVSQGKGYVEMTGIDSETSQDIADAIMSKGGRYLEAQIQGSKSQAEEGTLIILAAGERSLFEECQTCFEAVGKNSFYLGDVGNASKMNLVLQMMSGVTLAALAEAMALADRAGLQQKDVLEVLELTSMSSAMILEKGHAIIEGSFPTHQPLAHMQKDLKLSLGMADNLEQPLPLAASSNEVYKHAKRLGYGEHDTSAVYVRARF